MDGAIRLLLWGTRVPPGKRVSVGETDGEMEMTTTQITQVALGENAGTGRTVIYCSDGQHEWVMGSLTPGSCEQFQTDYMGRHTITVRHTGRGDVYVSGFKTTTMLEDESEEEDDDDEQAGGGDSSDEEEEEDDEEEDGGRAALIKRLQQQENGQAGGDSDEEDDEDDEGGLQGQDFSDMEDDDEEDEDDDDEEDESEEEEARVPASAGKRAAAATPQPAAKKAKGAAATPAVAAAKTPQAAAGDASSYEKALRQFLRKEGAVALSTLGSKVQGKPAGCKVKKFIEDRPALFRIDAEGKVSLASS